MIAFFYTFHFNNFTPILMRMKIHFSFTFLSIATLLFSTIPLQGQKQTFESHDGINISYYDEGKGDPVLLIHGFINTADSWYSTPLKDSLLANGYRVIIPDLRGNGDSDKPKKDKYYKNRAERKDLLYLMKHLKIKNYKVVAYSRGSIVLADLLKVAKDKITIAVLGGMGDAFTNPEWKTPKEFAKAFAGKEDKYPNAAGAINYAKSINADLNSLSLQQAFQPTTTAEDWIMISTPILLLNGEQDDSNGSKEGLDKLIPNSKLKFVPGDHNTCYRTVPFAVEALNFLKTQ